jgi:hypothetical protein
MDRLRQIPDRVAIFVAWHLPRRVVRWTAIRLICHATQGKWNHTVIPDLTAIEALTRWD